MRGDRAADDFDLASAQIGVHQLSVPGDDLAFDRDDALGPQALDCSETGRAGVEDDLGQAVMVAQVDKQQIAVIALAVNPARQADLLANIGSAKRGATVGAICVHGNRQS